MPLMFPHLATKTTDIYPNKRGINILPLCQCAVGNTQKIKIVEISGVLSLLHVLHLNYLVNPTISGSNQGVHKSHVLHQTRQSMFIYNNMVRTGQEKEHKNITWSGNNDFNF